MHSHLKAAGSIPGHNINGTKQTSSQEDNATQLGLCNKENVELRGTELSLPQGDVKSGRQ